MIKTSKIISRVAFFGDGEAGPEDKHYQLAYRTAILLAENGYITVNGGGPGIMLASTLGAEEVKGQVEVVVIEEKKQPKGNYEGQSDLNVGLADKIYNEIDYLNRIGELAKVADAFLIFKGGTGTIAELGYVWSVAKFEHGHHEPVIFVGKGWKRIIGKLKKFLNLEKKEMEVVYYANDGKEVLKILQNISLR